METIKKLENMVAKVAKDAPHLPEGGRKWLGTNVWWIVAAGVGIGALASLIGFIDLFRRISIVNSFTSYLPVGSITAWATTVAVVSLIFVVVQIALLAFAIQPLRQQQKRGWTLLFVTSLVSAVAIIVNAILSLDALAFVVTILFGAVILAAVLYLTFEIRSQFDASAAKPKPAKVTAKNTHKEAASK